METMVKSGNRSYIFDINGNGMYFNCYGRCQGDAHIDSVSFCKNAVDVQVISVLGIPGSNVSDIYYDGYAGESNIDCSRLISKARLLKNLLSIPLRVVRDDNPDVIQVLFVSRKGSYSRLDISTMFGINSWRVAK